MTDHTTDSPNVSEAEESVRVSDQVIFHYNDISDALITQYDNAAFSPQDVGKAKTGAGFSVQSLGWAATTENQAVLLNVAGTRVSVEATIAAFHNNRITNAATVHKSYWEQQTLKTDKKGEKFLIFRKNWEGWNMVNTLIVSERVVNPKNSEDLVFVIADNTRDLIQNVFLRLHNGLPIPIMQWWATTLFRKGREDNKIRRIPGDGILVYQVELNESYWSQTISTGLRQGTLIWSKGEHEAFMLSHSTNLSDAE